MLLKRSSLSICLSIFRWFFGNFTSLLQKNRYNITWWHLWVMCGTWKVVFLLSITLTLHDVIKTDIVTNCFNCNLIFWFFRWYYLGIQVDYTTCKVWHYTGHAIMEIDEFEDTKGVITIHKSKKNKQRSTKHTIKLKIE